MIEIKGIKLPVTHDKNQLEHQICKKLRLKQTPKYEILKRSIDARKKPDVFYLYNIGVFLENESKIVNKINNNNIMLTKRTKYQFPKPGTEKIAHHPLIIGAGPAGLFCALSLAKSGYVPIVVERGKKVEERTRLVDEFWNTGKLDTARNVQFGEGGAGTFSDGKLNTQV